MKKIIIIMVLIAFTSTLFAQHLTTVDSTQREELLWKSKRQKTTAKILLYTGIVAVPVGFMIFFINALGHDEGSEEKVASGGTLFIIGSLSMIGSIPFYVLSAKNKRYAMGLSAGINIEKGINNKRYPALSINIKLK